MGDGYAYILNAFYWRGKGKTMFSPILEVTSIQDGGALAEKVYRRAREDRPVYKHGFALPTPGVGTAESQRLVFEEKPPLRGAPYSRQRHRRGTASEPRVGVYTSFHVMCERSQS